MCGWCVCVRVSVHLCLSVMVRAFLHKSPEYTSVFVCVCICSYSFSSWCIPPCRRSSAARGTDRQRQIQRAASHILADQPRGGWRHCRCIRPDMHPAAQPSRASSPRMMQSSGRTQRTQSRASAGSSGRGAPARRLRDPPAGGQRNLSHMSPAAIALTQNTHTRTHLAALVQ